MARELNGSNQYFTATPPQRGFSTLTVSLWFRSGATTQQKLIGVWNDFGGNLFEWLCYLDTSYRAGGAVSNSTGTIGNPVSANNVWSANTWTHFLLRLTGANAQVYINGSQVATAAWSATLRSGSALMSIGCGLNNTTAVQLLTGGLAEIGIYPVSLADSEVAALAKAVSPHKVRPQSLIWYSPFVREPIEVRRGAAITAYNSPTVAAHPRIYL